jgi:hypothetical protein
MFPHSSAPPRSYCFERAGLPPEKQLSDVPYANETGLKFRHLPGGISAHIPEEWADPSLQLPEMPNPPREVRSRGLAWEHAESDWVGKARREGVACSWGHTPVR